MRYVEDHRRQTHSRIVENASYGLRQNGAEGLSVVELMKLAGLTHGGFYNHFDSRAALVGEAIAFAMDQMVERWKKLANGKGDEDRFEALIADYLSPRHRDNPRHGCALPALAADVARSSAGERRALASKLEDMIDVFVELLPDETPQQARQIATGAIAAMVGSIVLSRAVGAGKLSDSILDAGRMTADRRRQKPRRRTKKAIRDK
ncbi:MULTISPECIES: TetR/AcrR family transcriptional regulator [Bradyrhizobium]|jgi:TetR/AcrR family transcriptional regulator, transcriptional repressor for nem operon|uniref:TetR/AcrR family transcriptional regulator n=1 Tax=Bradyrhizobium TaxID=374 RepID=UPI001BA444FA|nr:MULTISPECIES: TetR/AcrR family transcriptional regulator [Bradyrhizobium]MBR0815579.1 TetR/AcrR family transcriptional regulator [Bradyrhizobium diazoefficiens]WOH76422.1 TetR/AcrR family transcriptional regulator [Bradyrhizobium sp. NDS-1]